MSKRNRERRRLRKTGQAAAPGHGASRDVAEATAFLKNFEKQVNTPIPAIWPGACDASLARPDLVKLDFASFALNQQPGYGKARELKHRLAAGPLADFRKINEWAMEEFLYHGLPGDDWSPLDAFLAQAGDRFSEQACEQLRLWKQATFGCYEIGPVVDGLVTLCAWDPLIQSATGPEFRAIALNIGGVNLYREHCHGIQLGYVAPWLSTDKLHCLMGYGVMASHEFATVMAPLLALQRPDEAARPLPWKTNTARFQEHAAIWRQRYWHAWLAERLTFPFESIVIFPDEEPFIAEVTSLVPMARADSENVGIYLALDMDVDEPIVLGATNIVPYDPLSAGALALAEYRAYRNLVGPPPGMRNL